MYQFIYLCGGLGKQKFSTGLFHKPLNNLFGKPMFFYTLPQVSKLYVVYNEILQDQNLSAEISKTFPHKNIQYYQLPYITRGPLETAYLAVKNLSLDPTLPLIFIDNDNIYDFPENINCGFPFIAYSQGTHQDSSFICFDDSQKLIDIKEKEFISNYYAIGVYGFPNLTYFLNKAKETIHHNIMSYHEFYFSNLFKFLLSQNQNIQTIPFKEPIHLGSPVQVIESFQQNPHLFQKLRICFDLDNTLVSYPKVANDYTTCEPIQETIDFLRRCKEMNHTIIVHTARRMKTHGGSMGKVMADIGKITFDQLDQFNIPYDEIVFGKPEADFYIDDKAVNPFVPEWKHWIGFLDEKIHNKIINQLPTNNINSIIRMNDNRIHKKGPTHFMNAQASYLEQITHLPKIQNMFPTLFSWYRDGETTILDMEYLQGVPIYKLYQEGLLTKTVLLRIFDQLELIHHTSYEHDIDIREQVYQTWYDKLETRIQSSSLYDDFQEIAKEILINVKKYCETIPEDNLVDIIHGDFWFSNIILTFEDELKFIDPRGKIGDMITLSGDRYYDYAKFYQSCLGYDCILHEKDFPDNYIEIKEITEDWFRHKNVDIMMLKWLTKGLILGTFPFIKEMTFTMKSRFIDLLRNV